MIITGDRIVDVGSTVYLLHIITRMKFMKTYIPAYRYIANDLEMLFVSIEFFS